MEWAGSLFHYDLLYMAKVFDNTYTADDIQAYSADQIVRGGTGYSLRSKLPDDIEHTYPDYELYGIKDKAYGYLTRGCPFCIVAEKEGRQSVQVAELAEFWSGQKEII